jgi:hypothetical protein
MKPVVFFMGASQLYHKVSANDAKVCYYLVKAKVLTKVIPFIPLGQRRGGGSLSKRGFAPLRLPVNRVL